MEHASTCSARTAQGRGKGAGIPRTKNDPGSPRGDTSTKAKARELALSIDSHCCGFHLRLTLLAQIAARAGVPGQVWQPMLAHGHAIFVRLAVMAGKLRRPVRRLSLGCTAATGSSAMVVACWGAHVRKCTPEPVVRSCVDDLVAYGSHWEAAVDAARKVARLFGGSFGPVLDTGKSLRFVSSPLQRAGMRSHAWLSAGASFKEEG